jgi:aryl-alcohol dehydrogenase-like predicted oxidoreductase
MGPTDVTAIPRKPLFSGGPAVSRLCLGTMMFGDQTDEAEAARILDAYFEGGGGDFIDTADTYVDGESERILGRLLGERRKSCFLATKVGNPLKTNPKSGGISRQWIARAAEDSLDRLQTDVIDLYYLHLDDNVTPLEETIAALGELISAGKVVHWGFSNFRAWKIAEMIRVADSLGVARPVAAQPYYHMLNRVVEMEYLPACLHFGIGAVAYSPLARGVLTGKYRDGVVPEGSRAARNETRIMETEFRDETIAAANRAADHAVATGRDPVGLAIQWVLANDAVPSVLIGPKTLAQLETYVRAVATVYTADDEAVLSALCASGHTPVPGHSDPRYPLRGRVTSFAGEGVSA